MAGDDHLAVGLFTESFNGFTYQVDLLEEHPMVKVPLKEQWLLSSSSKIMGMP
jgi:hypothetical protein